jgi:hypothetical protein
MSGPQVTFESAQRAPQPPLLMPSMTTYQTPVVATRGNTGPEAPLVVLLHGRGSDEQAIVGLSLVS